MRRIIEKLFCKHKWETHAKHEYKWTEKKVREETWYKPVWDDMEFEETNEVLICQHCGKVKQISY